jgi:hypothetical protein
MVSHHKRQICLKMSLLRQRITWRWQNSPFPKHCTYYSIICLTQIGRVQHNCMEINIAHLKGPDKHVYNTLLQYRDSKLQSTIPDQSIGWFWLVTPRCTKPEIFLDYTEAEDDESVLIGNDVALVGRRLPALQRTVVPWSSRLQVSKSEWVVWVVLWSLHRRRKDRLLRSLASWSNVFRIYESLAVCTMKSTTKILRFS